MNKIKINGYLITFREYKVTPLFIDKYIYLLRMNDGQVKQPTKDFIRDLEPFINNREIKNKLEKYSSIVKNFSIIFKYLENNDRCFFKVYYKNEYVDDANCSDLLFTELIDLKSGYTNPWESL